MAYRSLVYQKLLTFSKRDLITQIRIAEKYLKEAEDKIAAAERHTAVWEDAGDGISRCSHCGTICDYPDMLSEPIVTDGKLMGFACRMPYYCKRCGAKMEGGEQHDAF